MNNEWFNEIIGQVQEEMERLKELSIACEKQEVYYKTMISTHEVTIGQQTICIKKLERQLQLTMVNPLETAQEMVADNVETIVRLHEQLKEMDEYAQEGWDLAETYSLEIKNLETDIHTLEINGGDSYMWDTKASGRGMVEYPFNPEGETPDTPTDASAIYREKYPSAFKPVLGYLTDFQRLSQTEDTLFPGNTTPEPYPHTNPIREVPMSGRVKEKK